MAFSGRKQKKCINKDFGTNIKKAIHIKSDKFYKAPNFQII